MKAFIIYIIISIYIYVSMYKYNIDIYLLNKKIMIKIKRDE
jgi:cell division protein FtsL